MKKSIINKKYTHFIYNKKTFVIHDGYDYKGLDNDEIKHWFKIDIKDLDLDPKEYSIATKRYLLSKGIDPFNSDNWYKFNSVGKVKNNKTMPVKKAVRKKVVAPRKKAVAKKVVSRKKAVAKKPVNISYDNSWGKYLDSNRPAKKAGKRISAEGNVYYEYRRNRTDANQRAKKGQMLGINDIRLTRINNDTNGNPRYVVHFLELLNNEENEFLDFSKKYDYALKKAKKIGGKKFHNKQYGGGIVFQSYNTNDLKQDIMDIQNSSNIK